MLKFDANAASIENPLLRSEFEEGPRDLDPAGDVDRDRGMDYDYAFLNQPPYAGGFPRDLRALKRHHRLMKRMKRFASGGERPAFPPNKIPPGCCSCGGLHLK